MTNYDVVKKLIGPINPVGETNEDNRRLENLKAMCELMDAIFLDIDYVSYNYRDRHEFSIKRANEYAKKHIDSMGIVD
jgi:hypothetical protein